VTLILVIISKTSISSSVPSALQREKQFPGGD
jgi:hypothetical protein